MFKLESKAGEASILNLQTARSYPSYTVAVFRFHCVFAPIHAWREFVVPGSKTKRTYPAQDDPTGSDPPPTSKQSTGRAPGEYWLPWSELLRRTVGVDPEICSCGARMIVVSPLSHQVKINHLNCYLGLIFYPDTSADSALRIEKIFSKVSAKKSDVWHMILGVPMKIYFKLWF